MAENKYPNNEDIVITMKRLSPETQRMDDPNKEKAKYHYKDGQWRKGKGRNILRISLEDEEDLLGKGKSVMQQQEEKRFMDILYNSCQRCGKDISSYKALHPQHYTYGLCLKCNEIVSGGKEVARY